ncbi:MAG: trypsin-like peptidase domain-containing protein [Clostridia bacterium]|nr:trypsin-like peptidase domain-containing protein [Clostridia bacterium]
MDDNNKDFFNTENEETAEFKLPEEEKAEPEATVEPAEEKIETSSDSTNSSSYSSRQYSQNPYSQNPYSQSNYSQNPYSQPGQNGYYYTGTPDNNYSDTKKHNKKGLKTILSIVAVIVALSIAFGIGTVVGDNSTASPDSGESFSGDGTIITNNETPDSPKVTGDKLSTEQIAEIGRASNVGVLVYSQSSGHLTQSGATQAGEGTGIVAKISDDKKSTYILTCSHVISDKGVSVKILLEDGTTYDADIVGFDQQTDVGVLKVKTTKLKCAEFGDFKKLKVGSPVYAVGNPGGSEFFGSVTNGIVSAISRSINNEIGYTMDCIQHNAAINPGNSGGALLNEYGQVIGINSSKIASTEYEGMSFSVPISTALEVANDLIAKGYVPNRPKLGITYSLASSHNTYAMVVQIKGLPAGSLIIRGISSDSDLKTSDIQVGDMITAVNGKDLDTPDVLLDIIDKSKVGDELKLKICRVNTDYSVKEFEVTAKLIEDKGSTATEDETTTYINPFDYFNQYGNGGYGY